MTLLPEIGQVVGGALILAAVLLLTQGELRRRAAGERAAKEGAPGDPGERAAVEVTSV